MFNSRSGRNFYLWILIPKKKIQNLKSKLLEFLENFQKVGFGRLYNTKIYYKELIAVYTRTYEIKNWIYVKKRSSFKKNNSTLLDEDVRFQ